MHLSFHLRLYGNVLKIWVEFANFRYIGAFSPNIAFNSEIGGFEVIAPCFSVWYRWFLLPCSLVCTLPRVAKK